MFLQTWNKYLPVIKILLKRSVKAEQMLDMNSSDFQRASGGKKVKFMFSVQLVKGRLGAEENSPPIAKDLFAVLKQDNTANKFMQQNELVFTMDNNFRLIIKNNTIADKIDEEIVETAKEDPATQQMDN
jgi:hypothetical protein